MAENRQGKRRKSQWLKKFAGSSRQAGKHRSMWRPLRYEWLETRQMLSANPVGGEFQVNTYTTGSQDLPEVATDAAGDFVVVWQSDLQDGSGYGIYAQRYNSAGITQGSEFLVNTYTTGAQDEPAVAMDAAGDFVVAWRDVSDGDGISARLYNAAGVAQGGQFQVDTDTAGAHHRPMVAMDPQGDFVIAWQSNSGDGSDYGVFARLYNAAGVAQGKQFQVNTYTRNNQETVDVAFDSEGDFVIVWTSNTQDGAGYGVYAQRYNSSGAEVGSEFQVNTYTTNNQKHPGVAAAPDGDFVITWQGYGPTGSSYDVFAQQYNAAGAPQGSQFQVNTYTTGKSGGATVAMDANGDFVVTWDNSEEDGSGTGIFAQAYNAAGVPQGSEFRVNSYTTGNQGGSVGSFDHEGGPSVAMDAAGDFEITWHSYGEDGSSYGVYAQRYLLGGSLSITTTPGALTYIVQSGAQVIDPGLSIADTDGTGISSATVAFSSGYDSSQDVLAFANELGITGSFDSLTGTLTLNGTTTVANYQTALESITYTNTASNPSLTPRTVSFVVNDGTNASNPASRTIGLVASPPTQLVVTAQPPLSVTAGAGFGFTVAAEDGQNNLVVGYSGTVTVALANNPGGSTLGGNLTVTIASGLAVFSGLTLNLADSGYTLDVSSAGLTSATSSPIAVTPGAASQVWISTQPPATVTAGAPFGLTVVAEDAEGNVDTSFSGAITAAIANNPGSGTLGGTTTVSATGGVAVFSDLTLDNVGTGYALNIAGATLTAATTDDFDVIPGAASQLVISSPFPTNVTAGAPFGFTAVAEDAEGNLTTDFTGSVTVALATNPGGSMLAGTTTVAIASGQAVFSGLSLANVASGYQLSVTASGIPAATIGPFNITPLGVATHLVIESAPPASVAPGAAFAVTVEAEDDLGTLDTSFNGSISLGLASNPGGATLAGTASASASAGVATFSGLSLDNPGTYTLQATNGDLTPGTTDPFDVVGTLTIDGTTSSNVVQITFTDATDFQVVINGGAPATYSTTTATKLVYNAPAGTFSEVVFDDQFNTYTATQSFAATDIVTSGFEFDANNVVNLYVYVAGGASTATVNVANGSESNFYVGDAQFDYSYLGDPATGIYSELSGFASETVTGSGGATYAYVYSTSQSSFVGDPGGSTFTTDGLTISLNDFPQVYAVGAADGTDNMTLHTEGGSFVGEPSFSYVGGTFDGAAFLIGALYAANVTTEATNPTDQAFFYSYAANTFNGSQGSGLLTGSAAAFANFPTFITAATGFQSITVLESGADTDVANLSAPANATFTETSTASTLVVGGVSVLTIDTFFDSGGSLVAVPSVVNVQGRVDGSDTANLYDTAGTNVLIAQGDKATLTTAVSLVSLDQFGQVNAYKQSGSIDTVQKQAIDFALQTIGNWTSI